MGVPRDGPSFQGSVHRARERQERWIRVREWSLPQSLIKLLSPTSYLQRCRETWFLCYFIQNRHNVKFTTSIILNIRFSGSKYFHVTMQLLSPSTSRTFHYPKQKKEKKPSTLKNKRVLIHPDPGNHCSILCLYESAIVGGSCKWGHIYLLFYL